MRGGWIYILASRYRGTLYIGVMSNIAARNFQHREGGGAEFTRKYDVTRLVYAEQHATIEEAIAREKMLKRWKRDWKFRLIEEGNPDWTDLFDRING